MDAYRLGTSVLGAATPSGMTMPDQSSVFGRNRHLIAGLVVGGVALAGLGTTVYFLAKAKWGWAALTFFVLGPVATGLSAGAAAVALKPGGPNA